MNDQEQRKIPASELFSVPRIPLTLEQIPYYFGVESLMDSNDDDSETEDNCIDNASENLNQTALSSTLSTSPPSFHANIPHTMNRLFETALYQTTFLQKSAIDEPNTTTKNLNHPSFFSTRSDNSPSFHANIPSRLNDLFETALHQTTFLQKTNLIDESSTTEKNLLPSSDSILSPQQPASLDSTIFPSFHAHIPPRLNGMFDTLHYTTFLQKTNVQDDSNSIDKDLNPPNSISPQHQSALLDSTISTSFHANIPPGLNGMFDTLHQTTFLQKTNVQDDSNSINKIPNDNGNRSSSNTTFISSKPIVPRESILFPKLMTSLEDVEEHLKSVNISQPSNHSQEIVPIQQMELEVNEKKDNSNNEENVEPRLQNQTAIECEKDYNVFRARESKLVRPLFPIPAQPPRKSALKRPSQISPRQRNQDLREISLNYSTPTATGRRKSRITIQEPLHKYIDFTFYSSDASSLVSNSPARKVLIQKGVPTIETISSSPLFIADAILTSTPAVHEDYMDKERALSITPNPKIEGQDKRIEMPSELTKNNKLVFDDTDVCFDSDFADASTNSLSVDRQTCSLLERARANDSLFFLSTTNQANLSSSPIMLDSRYENSFNFGGESIIDGTSKTDDDVNDSQEISNVQRPCKQTVTKTVLNDTDICFDSGLAEPGCSFSSAQRTPTSPSPGIVEGDSVFFKSNLPYNDVSDSMYQQFDLLSSPSQSPINDDKIGASLMVDDEEPIDQTLDRTNNNNSPTIKHYYKSVKQDSPVLVFQPKLIKKDLNSPSMRMGFLRRSTRTRLARLPAGIGCKPIYKTNANGDRELVGATEVVATDPLLKKHQMLNHWDAMERECELRNRKRALRKRKRQRTVKDRISEESSDSD